MWKFFLGLAKGELFKRARLFTWGAREQEKARELGISEGDLVISQKVNRMLFETWLDRQIKE